MISGAHIRARLVIQSVQKYCSDLKAMRALAFCVSVRHAEFMAEQFKAAGLSAVSVTGGTDREQRQGVPGRLASGQLQIVCTCDLYNEGVDLPDVNTLLLLRPTQSPVLFEQQLGRGLRLALGKESCLVLDFVGRYRDEFRFDQLLQVMTGLPKRRLIEDLEHGFPTLPPGCHIAFDRVAGERVTIDGVEVEVLQVQRHAVAAVLAQRGGNLQAAGEGVHQAAVEGRCVVVGAADRAAGPDGQAAEQHLIDAPEDVERIAGGLDAGLELVHGRRSELDAREGEHALPDRLFHWLSAACVLTLLGTAFLPILGLPFGWVTVHWVTGVVLIAAV